MKNLLLPLLLITVSVSFGQTTTVSIKRNQFYINDEITYKGRTYSAEIKDGAWIGSDGKQRRTPSEAACAITDTNVNGWRFWKVKRPSDTSWKVLNSLRP